MQQTLIIHQHRPLLLLFFAGWGMDETPFLHYRPKASDFMICYDYRTLDFDETLLKTYQEIHLVAWSMGVWAASQVLQRDPLPITQRIAINGTPYPIDERRGIPPALFQGTLDGLDEASLLKFYRRMCADKKSFERFLSIAPRRPIEELRDELAAIGRQQVQSIQPIQQVQSIQPIQPAILPQQLTFVWQQAVIGENDRIFPPAHQQEAWKGESIDTCIESSHEAHYDEALFRRYLEEYEHESE